MSNEPRVPHTPGFPERRGWGNTPHAAFLNESRTRGTGWRCVQEIRVSRSFFARCGIPRLSISDLPTCKRTLTIGTGAPRSLQRTWAEKDGRSPRLLFLYRQQSGPPFCQELPLNPSSTTFSARISATVNQPKNWITGPLENAPINCRRPQRISSGTSANGRVKLSTT